MSSKNQVRRDSPQFLKWAGSKRSIAARLVAGSPPEFANYYEPFLGAGAMFFALRPKSAILSDANEELINVFTVVRDCVEALIADLEKHLNEESYFLRIRMTEPSSLCQIERASRLIFLNRTCFNGLYRVNRRGKFNTPFGRYKNPLLCPAVQLRAASRLLQGVTLEAQDFYAVTEDCTAADFVYFDPPYIPAGKYSDFRRYHSSQFSLEDHARLATRFEELDQRGCFLMLSNSYTPLTLELFSRWTINTIDVRRSINSVGTGRGPVQEAVITNY